MKNATRITLLDEIRATHSSDRWNEFFEDYGQLLRKWLITKNVDPTDAEDIQQETMMAVMRDLPKFEHNGRTGAFRLWLKRILTHRIRQVFDKRKARKEVSNLDHLAETLADEETDLSKQFQNEHDQFLIRKLLLRAETQFKPIKIRLFRELVIEEIPIDSLIQKYEMSSGAIRVQQHRILKWLKNDGAGLVEIEV